MSMERFLKEMLENGEKNRKSPFGEQDPTQLKKAFDIFTKENTFSPGDIVEWKPGMKNRRSEGPYVVVKVLDTPVVPKHENGTPLFNEPLDLAVGIIDSIDGEFMVFHIDSRRMQHIK